MIHGSKSCSSSCFVTSSARDQQTMLQFLEHYKLELARRRFGPNATASVNLNRAASSAAADEPPPAKKARFDVDRHYSGEPPSITAVLEAQCACCWGSCSCLAVERGDCCGCHK